MNTDPILHLFTLALRRVALFVVLSVVAALTVWFWLLHGVAGVAWSELVAQTGEAMSETAQPLFKAMLYGCAVIGVQAIIILFLLIALWWRGRGEVQHRRGANLIDQRS